MRELQMLVATNIFLLEIQLINHVMAVVTILAHEMSLTFVRICQYILFIYKFIGNANASERLFGKERGKKSGLSRIC